MIRLLAWLLAPGFVAGAVAFARDGEMASVAPPPEVRATVGVIRDGGPFAEGLPDRERAFPA